MKRAKEWFGSLSKRSLFLVILGVAGAIALSLSFVARLALFDRPADQVIQIGVLAPQSGEAKELGRAIREGVELYIDHVNRAGGIDGVPLKSLVIDDSDDPASARAAAEKAVAAGVVGVVGHWSGEAAEAAADVYHAARVPALTPAPAPVSGVRGSDPWLFHMTFDRVFETRFLANYVRNVLGEKVVSIIHQRGAEEEALSQSFDEVMQRFGTRVLNRWEFDPAAPDVGDRLARIVAELREGRVSGSIVVLADPHPAGTALAALRKGGIRNRVAGLRSMATQAFLDSYRDAWNAPGSPASGLHGSFASTPLMYDTAGEMAQNFRTDYIKAHRTPPDWVSAIAYEGARRLVLDMAPRGARRLPAEDVTGRRERIHAALAKPGRVMTGLLGPLTFDAKGVAAPTAYVGTYDGAALIAALTQLSPIREESVGNYLDELVAGRALYVNDRFMYKTNVVYAGVTIDKITGFDPNAGTAELALNLWFRWRGDFAPQDIVFTNAVQPIKLDKPERQVQVGDMLYHAYRIKGTFYTNYSSVERAYGTHIVGIGFRHRTLARNNLMYVSDVLGMNLNSATSLAESINGSLSGGVETADAEGSMLNRAMRWLGHEPGEQPQDTLTQMLLRLRALAGAPGWTVGRAWISQDVVERISEGDPAFVGFGKPQPNFSQLDMGALLKLDTIDVRDYLPRESLIYIAIIALVGSILARVLDGKDRGQFWRMQTLGLRLVCWPFLLLAAGNMALDYALANAPTGAIDMVVGAYSMLWWVIPARLATISLERFIWVPLEIRAARKVPNVIRMFAALVIYLFAFFGVIAYVFAKPVTSLLATSGLMAMIIGLAVQANIANIFSGIVLNIERPFKVGDYIKASQTVMGQVVDITWRTVRIRHLDGQIVCLANAKISEAEIHNFSDTDANFVRTQLFIDPIYDPRLISRLVKEALDSFDCFLNLASNYFGPDCQYKGVECVNGTWAARYRVKFYLAKGNDEHKILHEVWARVWERFQANGVHWAPPVPGAADETAAPSPLLLPPPSPPDERLA
jgi:potassium-dependent mechanosensitive channel